MRRMIGVLFVLLIIGGFQSLVHAQMDPKAKLKALKPKDYPTKEIEFVHNMPPGGGHDTTARVIAKYVEKYIETRCVVVPKTGAGGLIGDVYLTTQAKNDGYEVGVLAACILLPNELLKSKGKWLHSNLDPLAFINDEPFFWTVTTKGILKDKSFKEVIDLAKQKPGTLKIGGAPEGAPQWIVEQVEMTSGAKFVFVPFQGGKPGLIALLGGHIDLSTNTFPEFSSNLSVGEVKALAVTGREPHVYLPSVPTFNQLLGIDNLLWSLWRYASVPKGVPMDRFRYLEACFDAALRDPECIKEFEKVGYKIGPKYLNAKETREEVEKLYKAFKDLFVKAGRISQ